MKKISGYFNLFVLLVTQIHASKFPNQKKKAQKILNFMAQNEMKSQKMKGKFL